MCFDLLGTAVRQVVFTCPSLLDILSLKTQSPHHIGKLVNQTRTHARTNTHTHARTHAHTHAHTHTHTHTHTHIWTHRETRNMQVQAITHKHTCARMHARTHVRVIECMCLCVSACARTRALNNTANNPVCHSLALSRHCLAQNNSHSKSHINMFQSARFLLINATSLKVAATG